MNFPKVVLLFVLTLLFAGRASGASETIEFRLECEISNLNDCRTYSIQTGGSIAVSLKSEDVVELNEINVVSAKEVKEDFSGPAVALQLSPEAGSQMEQLTAKGKGRRLAIIIGDVVVSAPVILQKLGSSIQITLGTRRGDVTNLPDIWAAAPFLRHKVIETESKVSKWRGFALGVYAIVGAISMIGAFWWVGPFRSNSVKT